MARPKALSDDRVLDAALDVIREHGPERFTLADVSRSVSLSPATLIQRFGSKTALLGRAIARANRQLDDVVAQPIDAGSNPRRALIKWLVELSHPFRTRELIAAHLQVLQQDLLDSRMRVHARRHSQLVQTRIGMHLETMMDDATRAKVTSLAVTIEAQWHGLILQWAVAGRGGLDEWLRRGLERLLSALFG